MLFLRSRIIKPVQSSHKFGKLLLRYNISTELIKKQQKSILKQQISTSMQHYPKTFEQKAMILNSPRTIQMLEVVQFGAKYKKSNKWFPMLLLAAAACGYVLEKILPIRVTDRYFMVSPETPIYPTGYFFSSINFEQPFYLYLPIFYSLGHISKFINIRHMSYLLMMNMVVGAVLSQHIVDKRIQSYEVWNNEHLCHGQGCILSIIAAFCSALGPINSFSHLKSKIGLQTIPGLGITRRGIPVGLLAMAYIVANGIAAWKGQVRNCQVIGSDIIIGIVFGLLLRKLKPII